MRGSTKVGTEVSGKENLRGPVVSKNGRFSGPFASTSPTTDKAPEIVSCSVLINQRLVIFTLVDFLRISPRVFGYARVSTADQPLHLQTDALQAYGCAEVTQEKVSSVKERPALQHLLTRLRPGNTLVVWKLDQSGRSLKDLVTLVSGFQQKGRHFVSPAGPPRIMPIPLESS